MGVEKTFLVMMETPLGHDGPSPGDDASHAARCMGDEAEENSGMDGEVIDALLGLFNEGIPEQLPRKIFNAPVHLLESLVDRNGPNGNRGVTDDPLTGSMNVFSGGKVHYGVRSPLGGPPHLLHFLIDGRRYC